MQKTEILLYVSASIIYALLLVGLVFSVIGIITYIPHLLSFRLLEQTLQQFIADVLNLIIILELMALVTLYYSKERVKLEYALDAAIIFLVREIIINLYSGYFSWVSLAEYIALILTLFFVRTLAIKYSPDRLK